ncbi:MAG: uncharacterized protein KVP18_000243 [Porospora cf. gigantea A]|uniref:uncharacterized protein n=1 Tax=Porospora cf. gigantea A TaxID=2853593 RepID=UPI00355973D6|nr:MAG: hypothetical protein KVP18_000243 [Porospora cf. gigantea A]
MLRKCAVLVVTCLARRFTGHVGGLTSLLVGSLTYPNRMTAEAVTPDLRTGQWFHIERPPGAFVFHVRTLRKTSECAPGWLHLRAEEEDSAVLSGVAQGLTYVHMAPLQEQPIAPSQLDYSLPSTAVSCLRERLALLGVASLASSVLAAPQGNNAHTNPPPWSVLPLSSPHSPLLGDFSVVYQHMDTATIRDAAPKGKTGSKLAAMGLTANGEVGSP